MPSESSPPSDPPSCEPKPVASSQPGDVVENNSRPTYARIAAIGMIWAAASVLVAKVSGLGSQFVLGWLLEREDYGVFAFATAAATCFIWLSDGGVVRVLLQRGREYARLAAPLFRMAFSVNTIIALMLVAMGVVIWQAQGQMIYVALMAVIALRVIVNSPVAVLKAQASIDLQFRAISVIDGTSAILLAASMITFAALGFGPLSFVIPLIVATVYQGAAYYRLKGMWPAGQRLDWKLLVDVASNSFWTVLGTAGAVLAVTGDYLVLRAFTTDGQVGVYYFAYQLTFAATQLFSRAMNHVLMPSLTKVKDDAPRLARAFLKAQRVAALIVTSLGVVAAIIVEPVVRVLWMGKWDDVIPLAQVFAPSLGLLALSTQASAMLEAVGRWRLRAIVLLIHAACTMIAVAVGFQIAGLFGAACAVAVQHAINSLIQSWLASSVGGVKLRDYLTGVFIPMSVTLAFGALVWALSGVLFPERDQHWFRAAVAAGGFVLLMATLMAFGYKTLFDEVMALALGRKRNNPKTV